MNKKPFVSYNDFIEVKNEYLRDLDPLENFGTVFCDIFSIDSDRLRRITGVTEARVVIDELVEWVA